MKKLSWIVSSVLAFVLTVPATGVCYLVDTGERAPGSTVVSYRLDAEHPLIAVEFTNADTWHIGSIEGFFSVSGTAGIQAAIWSPHGSFKRPDTSMVRFSASPSDLTGNGWMGAGGLDWELPAGVWWAGFMYISGDQASWSANAADTPDDLGWEAQQTRDPDTGAVTWYQFNDQYNFTLRVGETSAVPVPSTMILLAAGLMGLSGFKRKINV